MPSPGGIGQALQVNLAHPLAQGLTSWWMTLPQNYGGGRLVDLVGGNHGSFTGLGANAGWRSRGRPGSWGSVLFDGLAGFVTCGPGALIDFNTAMTISFWVYPVALGAGAGGLLDKTDSGASGTDGWRIVLSNAALVFNRKFSTSQISVSTTTLPAVGAWTHVAVTWDGTVTAANTHIYENGKEVGYGMQINGVGTVASTKSLLMGKSKDASPVFANVNLDDIRVYRGVLSAAAVQEIYRNSQVSCPGLLAPLTNRVSVPPPVPALLDDDGFSFAPCVSW